jgi:phage FluMu protein Com
MPITFNCACGKILRVGDEHAGKRVKCPACNAIGSVPAPEIEPVFEVEEPEPVPLAAPPAAKQYSRPWQDENVEYDGSLYGVAKSGSGGTSSTSADGDDGPRDKPLPDFRLGSGQRKKKKRK